MRAALLKHRVALGVAIAVVVSAISVMVGFQMGETKLAWYFDAPLDVFPAVLLVLGWGLVLLVLAFFRTGGARARACIAATTTLTLSVIFGQSETVTGSVMLSMALCVLWISLLGLAHFPDKPRDGGDQP